MVLRGVRIACLVRDTGVPRKDHGWIGGHPTIAALVTATEEQMGLREIGIQGGVPGSDLETRLDGANHRKSDARTAGGCFFDRCCPVLTILPAPIH